MYFDASNIDLSKPIDVYNFSDEDLEAIRKQIKKNSEELERSIETLKTYRTSKLKTDEN